MRVTKRQKHYRAIAESVTQPVAVDQAVDALKKMEAGLPSGVKPSRFDQTVEIVLRLGVDPKQADQIVRGTVVLPHGLGKTKRVVVFAQGQKVKEAEDAGAVAVGGKELADRIKDGWLDFDVAIATPDMMGVVGPLGKVLGPRGLMPSPKAGTVTNDVALAVREYSAGKLDFRVDAGGNVHSPVGKLSFTETQLVENIDSFVKCIMSLKPQSAKGVYIRGACLSATMTPGIELKV